MATECRKGTANMEVPEILNKMTIRQKIGQLIIGQAEDIDVTQSFKQYFIKYPLCGYRVTSSNIRSKDQIKRFNESLQMLSRHENNGIDLILGSDEEGGVLSVFGNLVTEFPGNMPLGATNDPELAYRQGKALGGELSELGINLVFAPVADLNLETNNPVIGVRSFGDNPQLVSEFCSKYAVGLNDGGVANCAKHFPGHGNTVTDSHEALPFNMSDLETMRETELYPFQKLSGSNIDSVMVSHVKYPKITGNDLPSSLSGCIINSILRKNFGYDGIVVSDDMEMQAIIKNYSMKNAIRKFILAGGDVALINGTREAVSEAFESLLAAVLEGVISEERVNESVRRVLELKQKINDYRANKVIINENASGISKDISKKSITLVRDTNNLIPLRNTQKILLLVPDKLKLSQADTSNGQVNIYEFIKNWNNTCDMINLSALEKIDFDFILGKIEHYDVIIQCTINCARFPEQSKLAGKIADKKPLVLLMLRDPYDAISLPSEATVIAAYSYSDTSLAASIDVIFGAYEFTGKLPVKILVKKV